MLELVKFILQSALHQSYLMVIRERRVCFEDLLEISMQGCYMIKFFCGGRRPGQLRAQSEAYEMIFIDFQESGLTPFNLMLSKYM